MAIVIGVAPAAAGGVLARVREGLDTFCSSWVAQALLESTPVQSCSTWCTGLQVPGLRSWLVSYWLFFGSFSDLHTRESSCPQASMLGLQQAMSHSQTKLLALEFLN